MVTLFTETAFKHGYGEGDYYGVLSNRNMVFRSRRGYRNVFRNPWPQRRGRLLARDRPSFAERPGGCDRVPHGEDERQRPETFPQGGANMKRLLKATAAEKRLIEELTRRPVFERLDAGEAEIVSSEEWKSISSPERSETLTVPRRLYRRLRAASQKSHMTPDELAAKLLEEKLSAKKGSAAA